MFNHLLSVVGSSYGTWTGHDHVVSASWPVCGTAFTSKSSRVATPREWLLAAWFVRGEDNECPEQLGRLPGLDGYKYVSPIEWCSITFNPLRSFTMLKKIFSQHKTSHIAVVQYARPLAGYFNPKDPEHVAGFHLAIVAIEEDKQGREWRILWQANNRPVPGQGTSTDFQACGDVARALSYFRRYSCPRRMVAQYKGVR